MASIKTREEIEEIAKDFARLVQKELDVKKVYLFGSYAKGNFSEDSDIDIAVVGDDFVGDPVEDTMVLMRIRRNIDNRIEPRPFKTSDFNESNPISKEIMETGVLIM
ncbi:MAG: nucleotidyltransferase domain-containing protein [Firmicutes bacterium]|nr:nucleotidyltransferase domain-containing protein [Bacillota bacterium]